MPNEPKYEPLKKLRQRFDKVDDAIFELRNDNLSIGKRSNGFQGNMNGMRGSVAHTETRVDRIENRLEFRERAEAQARFEPHP